MKFRKEDFAGKKACVLGLARSGIECARLLAAVGFDVLLSESKAVKRSDERIKKLGGKIRVETGGHSDAVLDCGFAVKSPGIFPESEILKRLKKAGIPVFSEMEVALSFCPECEIFAVTGTNGKTTTTTLVGEILREAAVQDGKGVHVAGNIGSPLSGLAAQVKKDDFLVVEMSSYQLEDSTTFHPNSAGILNITPDHIDHHGSMEKYIDAKRKVFEEQTERDICVFNAADKYCLKLAQGSKASNLYFSVMPEGSVKLNARLEGKEIVFSINGATSRITPPELPGLHNIENAMCAGLMTLSRGIPPQAVQAAFSAFKGVEHRIEEAGTVKGVRFINDSKATNVDSTLTALKAMSQDSKNVWLILGGQDKGNPYSPLAPFIRKSVKTILTIGDAAPKIERELAGTAPVTPCGTLEKAISTCLSSAEKGDILLFSPACASFDQFNDYEHRGRVFKELANKAAVKYK